MGKASNFVGKDSNFRVEDFGLSCDGSGEAFGLSWGEIRAFVGGFWGFVWGFGCSWGGVWAFVGRVSGFGWEDFKLRGEASGFRGEEAFGLSWRFELSWGGLELRGDSGFRGVVSGFCRFQPCFHGEGFGVGRLSGFRGEGFGLSWGRLQGLVGRHLGEGFGLWWGGFWAFVGDLGFRGGLRARGEDLGFRIRGKRFGHSWEEIRAFVGLGVLWGFGFSWGFELSWGRIRAFESVLRIYGLGQPP